MTPSCVSSRTVLLSALLLTLTAPLAAQEAAPAAAAAPKPATEVQTVSPEAQAVLDRMSGYIRGLKSFSIESTTTRDDVVAFGYKLQHNETTSLTVQAPNKLRSEVTGDIRDRIFIYDGAKMVMYSPDDAVYTQVDAPDTIGKLIDRLLDVGVEMPSIDMLYQAYQGSIAADASGGVLVGESTIDGVDCDHLAFRQPAVDWQLWVEKGARPLPRKLVITTRYEVGDPQYQTTMRWNLNPQIDGSTFKFTAPKGVNEIPFSEAAALKAAKAPSGE